MNRKAGVILSYLLMFFEVCSTLLLTPFIIRTLGQSEYGVYKLAAALNAYLLLLDLGVGNAITRYISKYRAENNLIQGRRFLGVATIYYTVIAVLVLIIGLIVVNQFPTFFSIGLSNDEAVLGQKLLFITMINSAITLGTSAYLNVIIAYEYFWISKGISIVQIVIRMLLSFIALKLNLGSVGIVLINLLLTIIFRFFCVYFTMFRIGLRPLFKGVELKFIKEVFTYSSLIFLQMIATQLNSTIDQILIGKYVKSASAILAVYGVGTQIVQYFQSMGSAFNGVLMPGLVRMLQTDKSPERINSEMIRVGRVISFLLILILGGFLVNGKNFLVLWAGKENFQSYYVALILMIAYFFVLIESVGSQMLWALNEHKEQAILKIIIVLFNIITTVILIKWNPLYGATLGTFLSLMVGDVIIMNFIFVIKLNINLKTYYKGLFKGTLVSILISVVVGSISLFILPNGWISLLTNITLMTITYVITLMKYGFNSYEKKQVKKALMRIGFKL